MDAQLTDRQQRILALVVHEHVQAAQPVASGSLVRRYDLGVGTATVRSELAVLESLGLLMQPHTSAGRVPTVAGYRYFVEHLMRAAELPVNERRTIRHQFHQAGTDLDRWMRLAAAVVARVSGVVGLVARRETDSAMAPPQLYHAGLTQILYAPEFATGDRLRVVVELLEHGRGLEPILDRLPQTGVQVIIGGEPPLERTPHVALVLARFGPSPRSGGVIGVVGPPRLAYERAVPTVGYVARLMDQLMASTAV
ncbi:hypothetical protein DCC79_00965 [bacterium]|nr:hypothetical protein [Chloroflexi bacterium CFX6]RIL12569.1 MAG: hypothetical protein DCC79_00965 [bacterium]